MENSSACVSATVGRRSTKKTVLLTSTSSHMFKGNSDACVSAIVEILTIKKTVLLTSFHLIVFKGNRYAYVSITDRGLIYCLRHSLHSTMASAFITHSYQINFESVLMIHDHEGMLTMFKALEASGLGRFLGCESVLYEKELGHFFDTTLIQGEDVTDVISGKFVSISPTLFAKVFDLPTEGITNFSEVPKDTLYDARSFFSKEGVQIDRIHDSNCEILSKVNAVDLGVRGDLLKVQVLLRQSFETACRVLESKDLFDIKKKRREQDSKLITMDEQIAAIRSEHLDFQSKIAADILSLSTQVGDIADYLRGGAAKKGEIGSSSRPSTVRTQTLMFPPTTGTFEERVDQARRHIVETGQVISIEEAAERVIEADRRESDSFRKQLVQLDIVCFNRFDDVSHSRISDIMTSPSYSATTFPTRYDDILKQYYLSLLTPDFATVLFLETVQVTLTIDSFRKQLVQLDIVCFNRFDDVSHSRISDIMTSPSYSATTFPTDMMTSAVLKFVNGKI
ncbi:hypothetical protein F511_34952 [Dorcoceras hygrometricum]|uniref:Uncharacterized protein n=1 Tax=Dorcoceras hygrometricum TaxID=472368 RepID=A0A2Z7ADB7_9LAMI|nr:hypothetical protein F511_34952 [Dorcoceras hygrometricum]